MNGIRDRLAFGGVALLAVVYCAGIPLLLAAGLGVAALAVFGGLALAAIALCSGSTLSSLARAAIRQTLVSTHRHAARATTLTTSVLPPAAADAKREHALEAVGCRSA